MSNIIIKEYDNTTAGVRAYANFAVLVPGFVADRKQDENGIWHCGGKTKSSNSAIDDGADVFDDNGIYECTSQSEFLECIGPVPANNAVMEDAKAPELELGFPRQLDEEEFNVWAKGEGEAVPCQAEAADTFEEGADYYTRALDESREPGYLVDAEHYVYTLVENPQEADVGSYYKVTDEGKDASSVEPSESPLYICSPSSGKVGKLDDGTHRYTLVKATDEFDQNADYALLAVDGAGNPSEGKDVEYGKQYGNQVAYELLGLGYTVLYKKLEALSELTDATFYDCLNDKAVYDFRYAINGLLSGNSLANQILIGLAENRGDIVALIDVDSTTYAQKTQADALGLIKTELNKLSNYKSKYAAAFAPYVEYAMDDKHVAAWGKNKLFPATFHYLACAAKAAENYREWYAVAGYQRGYSAFTITGAGCKFGENAVNALEPRNNASGLDTCVNLIIKIRNAYYLWGNRTLCQLSDTDLIASHFLNIRQLCATLKKQIYVACRRFTYDPNSDLLWVNFCNAIRPTLETMKGDQGITDYKFIKIKNDQKAAMYAKIRIVPIEAVEDFNIGVFLEDSISGIIADIEEE